MTSDEALKLLQSINSIVAVANPLLGGLLAIGTEIVKDVRGQGASIGPFADEIAKFDALNNAGLAADDAWRASHGLPAASTQQGSSPVAPGSTAPLNPMTGA